MADNVAITAGSGTTIAADEVTRNAVTEKQQVVKLSLGAEGAFDTLVDSGQQTMANSVPVTLASDQSALPVTDNSGSITVDYATTGSGTATGALRVELPTNGTGVVGLNAGTNAIGKLAANSGVDIGDVDVTTVGTITPGTAATSLGKAEDAAHSSGDVGVAMLAVREATATDLSAGGTDGDYEPLQVDANGKLHVNAGTVTVASHAVTNAGTFAVQAAATEADGANTTLGAKADAKSTATDTTAVTAMQVLKQISASVQAPPSQATTNAGTFVVQENGALLTSSQLIDDTIIADDAAFTPATTKVNMAGFEADESSTDSVDEGDGGAARMTLDRKQIVTIQPHTAGGWTVGNFTSGDTYTALTNSAQVIKGSAGSVGGYYIYNPNAAATYVMVYNIAAASVTVGTSTALLVFCIPASSAANLEIMAGIPFDTAISVAAATTGGGAAAPSTALEAMVWYK